MTKTVNKQFLWRLNWYYFGIEQTSDGKYVFYLKRYEFK